MGIENIPAFLLGVTTGIVLYKVGIIYLIHKVPYTACDYCKFQSEKEKLWGK